MKTRHSFWASALALLLLVPLMSACTASGQSSVPPGCDQASSPCLSGKALVRINTDRGAVTLELNGDAASLTAGNFADLVKRGVYDGTVFHRVVREPVPFVVQGGIQRPRILQLHVRPMEPAVSLIPTKARPATSPLR